MRAPVRDRAELPTALYVLRIVRGWNQAELARAAGCSHAAISYYESGRQTPELVTLTRLLEAMGYQLSTLDEARVFIRQVRSGEAPAPETSNRLLALEVGGAVTRLVGALLEPRT